ncbi:unnamed protein product [Linum trigynum]|uniref:Uncharacterized protein n=1 Tax=Linum trigynum TaxID=586398 RepID=A0AAV2GMX0_9ROSI
MAGFVAMLADVIREGNKEFSPPVLEFAIRGLVEGSLVLLIPNENSPDSVSAMLPNRNHINIQSIAIHAKSKL